jgi:hypothetical protein
MNNSPLLAAASTAAVAAFASFKLDFDIPLGDQTIAAGTEIKVRKPGAGEFRGLTLMALSQLDYDALEKIAPRITTPMLTKAHVAAMDPADLMQFGGEVMDFLLPTAAKADSPTS